MNPNLKPITTEKIKRNWVYLLLIIIMSFPIGLAKYNYSLYYGVKQDSVQFLIILVGTVIMILFILFRTVEQPKISNLKLGTARLLFSTTVNFMLGIYAAFGIAFTILWGNLYTLAIENVYQTYIENLKGQGIILLFFIVISSSIILVTFLIPLMKRINELED